MEQFNMNSGGNVTKINRGRYSLTNGFDLIFTDDTGTSESVGCTNEDLVEVLIDRIGNLGIVNALSNLLPDPVEEVESEVEAVEEVVPKKSKIKKSKAKKDSSDETPYDHNKEAKEAWDELD